VSTSARGRRPVGRQQRRRQLERRGRLLDPAAVEQRAGLRLEQQRAALGVVVAELAQRLAEQRQRAVQLARGVRGQARPVQHLDHVDAAALLGVWHARPHLQRALEMAQRLRRRVGGGEPRRLDARGQRARDIVRGGPVQRERGGDRRGVAGQARIVRQGLRVGGVDTRPLARERVAVDRVAGQRVAEDVPARAALLHHEQVMLDGLAQRGVEARLVEAGDGGEQPVGHRAPSRRGDPQQRLGRLGEPLGAREQDVAQ
jgi:hypothetical protein